MRLSVLAFLTITLLITGCARVSTTSTLAADGSFQRKVVYTVNPSPAGTGQKPVDAASLFRLPKDGAGIRVETKTDAKGVQTVTVERTVAKGSPALNDITLLDDKGQPLATSTVTVTTLNDGALEYKETLHYAGAEKAETKGQTEQLRAAVKKALPTQYQKTELIDSATHKALVAAVHVLFGPAEPTFGDIMVNHDGAERRVVRLLFTAYATALHEAIPDMTSVECDEVARNVVKAFGIDQMNMDPAAAGNPEKTSNSSQNDMTPLFFLVATTGKIVETNGIIDPLDGKVYWSLFTPSLQVEDVTLRLVVKP